MRFDRIAMVAILAAASFGCADSGGATGDRFAGFYATPEAGLLELWREGAGYRGELGVDLGPFPVEGHLEGDVLKGTVTYAGKAHPIEIQRVADGVIIQTPEDRGDAIHLKKRTSKRAYLKSHHEENPDLGAAVIYEMPAGSGPTTRKSSSQMPMR